MSVPLLDVTRLPAGIPEALEAAAARVLRSGQYINGPEVKAFEDECAAYLGAGHAIGVSNGSDALLIALMALGVGPGDEVVVPTYTFFATAGAVARLGATPVFVDSEPDTLNIDIEATIAAMGERTKAVIPVHLFGLAAPMDTLMAAAQERGVAVIEDTAQSFGAKCGDRFAGAIGTVGTYSFFPSKNLGGFGDGGLVTTNDAALAERIRVLRAHGSKPKYHHHLVGGNFRLDALQAAFFA